MTKLLGTNSSFCLNTGTDNTPTNRRWTPLIAARDIKAFRAPGAIFDSSDRNNTINTGIPTRHAPSVQFKMIWNGGAGMTALRNAFVNGTPIFGSYLNGQPTTSAKGMCGGWAVSKFPLDFPLLDGQMVDIELKPHGNSADIFDFNYTDATSTAGAAETPVAKKLGTNASISDAAHAAIKAFQDIKLSLENGAEFDASDRNAQLSSDASSYYIQMVIPTRKKISVEAKYLANPADTQLATILAALLAGTPLELWVLDGAYGSGTSWGVHSDWAVEDFSEDSPLLGGQEIAIKLQPHGNYVNAPTFVTI